MNKKGFTLIELLVVIAIIGILSAIGLVALNGAREKARDAQRQSDIAMYRSALLLYYDANNNKYPKLRNTYDNSVIECINNEGKSWVQFNPASNNIFVETPGVIDIVLTNPGALITDYLSAQLTPPIPVDKSVLPVPATEGISFYCYDTNGDADAEDRNHFLLYTKLEGRDGVWYWVNDQGAFGTNANPHDPTKCVHTAGPVDSCDW